MPLDQFISVAMTSKGPGRHCQTVTKISRCCCCNVPRMILPLATPFGSVGSVYAWHRFGHVCALVLNVVFLLLTLRYVDDLSRAEGASLANSGRRISWRVISELVGWPMDPEKGVPAPHHLTVVVCVLSLRNDRNDMPGMRCTIVR